MLLNGQGKLLLYIFFWSIADVIPDGQEAHMKVALIKTMTKFLNLIGYQQARVQYVSVIYARCNRTAGLKMDSYFSPG